jgi:hypothetical protein
MTFVECDVVNRTVVAGPPLGCAVRLHELPNLAADSYTNQISV